MWTKKIQYRGPNSVCDFVFCKVNLSGFRSLLSKIIKLPTTNFKWVQSSISSYIIGERLGLFQSQCYKCKGFGSCSLKVVNYSLPSLLRISEKYIWPLCQISLNPLQLVAPPPPLRASWPEKHHHAFSRRLPVLAAILLLTSFKLYLVVHVCD